MLQPALNKKGVKFLQLLILSAWDVLESNRAERIKNALWAFLAKEPGCGVGRTGLEPVTSYM
jgi:hypothetical protein